MRCFFILMFCFTVVKGFSQNSLRVHFLYGSRPLKKFNHEEAKWFVGILGGHAGIEADSGKIVNFSPKGKFHLFTGKEELHSRYAVHSATAFYSIFGGRAEDAKKAIVVIPITPAQKTKFDSITNAYVNNTPYDYAFLGMRCGAAAYEILGQLGILPKYSIAKTGRRIFYPQKLRARLFKKAKANGWQIIRQEGTEKRKWEKDSR